MSMNETHPEPAEIAALGADLLPAEGAARLRDHLAHCTSCAEIDSDLAAVSRELDELPSPPLPDDVAARIDSALAAEAAAGSFHVKQRRRWPRMALAAAAALVAVGLGGALLQALPEIDSGTGSAEDAAAAESGHGDVQAADPSLETQVRELLAAAEPDRREAADAPDTLSSTEATEDGPSPGAQAEPSPHAALPSCVREAIARAEAPLAAGEEQYRGERAYLVVLPHAADPRQVDAYVVNADCVAETPPVSGEILARASYPRG
jgi:hypothetical protein